MNDRISVNQPPYGGDDYPLVGEHELAVMLADFYASYLDQDCAYAMPLRIRWLYGFGSVANSSISGMPTPTHAYDLLIVDADDVVVFDSTLATMVSTDWGTNRRVVEWRDDEQVARLVYYLDAATSFDQNLEYTDAVLDPRTCNRLPKRVQSVAVGVDMLRGDLRLEAGYNISLRDVVNDRVDGGGFANQIVVDAVPGAGLGRLPGCEETTPTLQRINRIGPDASGNFRIELDDCFRAQPPLFVSTDPDLGRIAQYSAVGLTSEEAKSALMLDSDCKPCCPCDYYVRTYRGMKRQWNILKEIALDAQAARDVYADNRDRWLAQRECRLSKPAKLVVQTDPGCKAFVGAIFCNMSRCCLTGMVIRFTFQRYLNGVLMTTSPTGVEFVESVIDGSPTRGEEDYTPQSYPANANWPVADFNFDYADPQTTSMAKFRICVPCTAEQTLFVTMTVHAPDVPNDSSNGEVCVQALLPVPDEITAIWNSVGAPDIPVRAILSKAIPFNPTPPAYPCGC